MSVDCLFCNIVNKSVESTILFEDEECVAIQDIFPKAPVHILVIPKFHLSNAADVKEPQEKMAGHLIAVAAKLAREKGLAEKGFRLVFNSGEQAGQTVRHMHLHLLGGGPLGGMC
jgi:histidine triad (HIT) family protein